MSLKFLPLTAHIIRESLVAYQIGYIADRCPHRPFQTVISQIMPMNSNIKEFWKCFIFPVFFFTGNSKYFSNSWCCILNYFILNWKLWDKFLNSMMILILIISYILMFYRNLELIFEFMALKRAPICGRNVSLAFFFEYFYI